MSTPQTVPTSSLDDTDTNSSSTISYYQHLQNLLISVLPSKPSKNDVGVGATSIYSSLRSKFDETELGEGATSSSTNIFARDAWFNSNLPDFTPSPNSVASFASKLSSKKKFGRSNSIRNMDVAVAGFLDHDPLVEATRAFTATTSTKKKIF